jgi:uncharacterized coiled-coil DUF342 family protein
MTKAYHIREGAAAVDRAIDHLVIAKKRLRDARSELHIRLAVLVAELEEIHDILTDPECTPEITETED